MRTKPPHRSKRSSSSKPGRIPVRLLTAVPICDGHDSAIVSINLEFVRHGFEVIYLGFHRSVRDIVRAAIQEDVRAIGLSSYNGGHVEFFTEVLRSLKQQGAGDIGMFGGGGGTITVADAKLLQRRGVDEIFFPGTPFSTIVNFVQREYGNPRNLPGKLKPRIPQGGTDQHGFDDRQTAKLLSASVVGSKRLLPGSRPEPQTSDFGLRTSDLGPRIVGITGPGGAGKTTLIDELALRFLNARPKGRLAILSHDPGLAGKGAMLGDRAGMVYTQNDRVFMRSIGTRGKSGGLSSATRRYLQILSQTGFELILVESAGIGQEDMPFANRLVDKQILVMSPDYGSRLQLQKIMMLEAADVVVINKSDLPGARTARSEIEERLAQNRRGQKLIATMAKQHRDAGVDQLFSEVMS